MLTPIPVHTLEISKILFNPDNISVPSFSAGSGSGVRGKLEELRAQRAQGGQHWLSISLQILNHSSA